MKILQTNSTKETKRIGLQIGKNLLPGDIVTLTGPLGAGKTIFVQGVAKALGIEEPITSPTFTLISEYRGIHRLYHMDLYRLESPEEFIWLGVEEILNSSSICLIEWGERAESILPDRTIHININIQNDGSRIISIMQATGNNR